jgi:hypothetical protein
MWEDGGPKRAVCKWPRIRCDIQLQMREREIHELTAEIRKLKTIGKSFRDSASIFKIFFKAVNIAGLGALRRR